MSTDRWDYDDGREPPLTADELDELHALDTLHEHYERVVDAAAGGGSTP